MTNIQVIGLGMSTLDILVRLTEMPSWENGGRFSAIAIDGGGPVATAIAAVSRLGVRAGFVGAYGPQHGCGSFHVFHRPLEAGGGGHQSATLCSHCRGGGGTIDGLRLSRAPSRPWIS